MSGPPDAEAPLRAEREDPAGTAVAPAALWIFGYGSLIWRPGFAHAERRRARVADHARRFWQGSTDHRGVPGAPGRVVTLVPLSEESCEGIAYRVEDALADATLRTLDHREKDGYARARLALSLDDGRRVAALTWIAREDNASWLGPAPFDALVRQILASAGPSGTNADYVLSLAEHLDALGIRDGHVERLARGLREAPPLRSSASRQD